MYQNGYVRTIHGAYEYMQVHRRIGFGILYKMQYNMVHHCLFKYEIFHSSIFGYMRVHHWLTSFVPRCCSTPGRRAGLKAAESQQLQGTQVPPPAPAQRLRLRRRGHGHRWWRVGDGRFINWQRRHDRDLVTVLTRRCNG
jgi:hypothetical protein